MVLEVDFLAVVFFAVVFLAVDFLTVPRRLGAGPLARLAASMSLACSGVTSSGRSVLGRDWLGSPSVMYGPKRPF